MTADSIELLGIKIDAVSLNVLRDVLTQNELINWIKVESNRGQTILKTYLTCSVCIFSQKDLPHEYRKPMTIIIWSM